MSRLHGKTALVTGAARGIGEAIARAFVREGARVMLTDIRDEQGLALARELGGDAAYAAYRRLDVRAEDDWRAGVDDVVARWGRLDVLVNNAGITGFEEGVVPHDPEHATLDAWRAVHATNLDGVFLGCKHAIRVMRGAGGGSGSIINISSRSGIVGIPGAAAYASSKAAVRNHTKSVALYCGQQGTSIRCNSIHPAAILTPMWDWMLGAPGPERDARTEAVVGDVPLRRFGTPDEVAAIALLLASDEATYMTGTEITLDGGILAGAAAAPGRR